MATQFTPGTGSDPTSTLEISISCRNLIDKDTFSRSDPMCVVFHPSPTGSGGWEELKRTEVIWDCLNPDFVTKLVIDYRFEVEQKLRFEVYDIDSPSSNLANHDFLGCVETNVAQIVSKGFNGLTLPLQLDKGKYRQMKTANTRGTITLLAEELVQYKEEVIFKLEGYSMSGSYLMGMFKSSIFFTLSKITESGNYTIVYRSPEVKGPNPSWPPVTISMRTLANGDKDRCLRIEVWKSGVNGYHKSLGIVHTTVSKMLADLRQKIWITGNNGKESKSSIKFTQLSIVPVFTFMDYISSGTQIHCCFAIDFTGSNGDPSDAHSLHHFTTSDLRGNPYEQAIQSVGEIIQDYNPTKLFPVYGFGARIPPLGVVSHNFPVTLNPSNPHCNGINGVIETYRNCIRQIQLFGPTNFAPIIRDMANTARRSADGKHYHVLLIITDGIITDMPQTKEIIVEAAVLPLSIIIVGVGNANFDAMQELDGDTVRLSYQGKLASRDIVQFVPYRDAYSWLASVSPGALTTSSYESTARLAKIRLAQEVLAEIPEQLTSFMKSRNILPGNN
ncbi:copine-8 [Folsomia candida]|uniref:Copine-8 n=1 Tax=Folsomia candida TaxID=158441 RepID=A0A226DKQ1_FOLCA|nr:copine-8 [Folsomia candida]OXA46122.1 Copine-8 [Folsomia candida]